MSQQTLRKAVIPAAGFGTRFLPFTKAVPKELIPLVDKPVIQYVCEEAAAAGITDICIILSSGKEAIPAHFNPAFDLEQRLEHDKKTAFLEEVRAISKIARFHFIYQQELKGLGHAVMQAESFAGDEPFAILLGDTVTVPNPGAPGITSQLVNAWRETGASVVATEEVPREKTKRYGILDGIPVSDRLYKVNSWVEKPDPETAPSNLAIASRYVFTPEIFRYLHAGKPGLGGEIQLTDAMRAMAKAHPMYGWKIDGRRCDIGNKTEFVKNTLEFAFRRPEFRDALLPWLKEFTDSVS